jgi:PAS domain S-box-containing protein
MEIDVVRERSRPMRLDYLLLPCSIALVALSAILSERNAIDFRDATREVGRLNRVIGDGELVLSSLKDLETGQRGYLLTGNRAYLTPFEQAVRDLSGQLEDLSRDAVDSRQQERVRRLASLVSEKRSEVEATILARDQLGPDAALAIVKTDKGRESMESIRSLSAVISRQSHEQLLAKSASLTEKQERGLWMSALITLTLFGFLTVATFTIQRGAKQREKLIDELSSARQQFHTTLLSIGDGVIATDANGNVTFLNSVACRITGWNQRDALGKSAISVLPLLDESTRQPIEHPVSRVLRSKKTAAMANHAILVRADGSEIPVDDSAAPIFAAGSDRLNGVVLVFRDITARYLTDRAIRKWEHVFQHAGFGMAVLKMGDDPLIEQANPAFALMHGYSPDELRGGPLSKVVSPSALQAELQGIRNAESDGHLLLETTHCRKDGSCFPTLADVTVVRDESGKVLYGTGYYSDITERVNAEEELRKNEARFRTLADSLPQLVWTTTPDGTPDYFNSRWEDEIGDNLEATEGQGFSYFLHPDDRERCLAEWKKSLAGGSVFQTECRLRSTKSDRWYICRAIPVRSADGRIVRWFGSCTDIDEQKKAAEALRASKDELQRSNLDLEQFAFAASHDLQEPLRMVVIYSQLLREEFSSVLEETGQTYLNFAVDGALRMELLLKGLLTYSRAAMPEDVAPSGGVPVSDAVQKVIANLALQIEETRAMICAGDLPRVDMPEVHIIQVFQNLITNAIKYRCRGVDPVVSISAVRHAGNWLFSIKDNGIGIEPKYRELIFRVFGRLHGAEYPGTGIGLALCQRLIERHGGRIWVDSEPGSGSTFLFTLPARHLS